MIRDESEYIEACMQREALGLLLLSLARERVEGQTGAGPVGSTDIKICGRAGREVTRFFIAVQVQREGRTVSGNTPAALISGACYVGSCRR